MSDQNKICGSPGTDAPPCGSRDVASVEATAALTTDFGPDHARWMEEQRAEQAKRWAIIAVIVANDHEGVILNYGGFEPFGLDGVGTWCSDEGIEVPALDRGIYYVSDIGIRTDEDSFEAWGTWTLIDPLTREAAIAKALGGDS